MTVFQSIRIQIRPLYKASTWLSKVFYRDSDTVRAYMQLKTSIYIISDAGKFLSWEVQYEVGQSFKSFLPRIFF